MPTQRITIAKVAGAAGDLLLRRFRAWSAARQSADPNEWDREQWSVESDRFIERLREAVQAWDKVIDRCALVVLREPIGSIVEDEEVEASLSHVPEWLVAWESSNA